MVIQVAGRRDDNSEEVLLRTPYPPQSPSCVHALGRDRPGMAPQEEGKQGRQIWEGLPREKTRPSTQEMLPCCGCLRNVLEAQGSLARTRAWFLCSHTRGGHHER